MSKNNSEDAITKALGISVMQDKLNVSLKSPSFLHEIQQTEKIFDTSIFRQLELAQHALGSINPPAMWQTLEQQAKSISSMVATLPIAEYQEKLTSLVSDLGNTYLDGIKSLNNALHDTDIFSGINSLRSFFPNSFYYEHNNIDFFNKEVYEKIFREKDDWRAKIEEKSLSVKYTKGDLVVEGTEIREIVAVKELFPELSQEDLVNFISYLKKFPFLAMLDQSSTGKKIFDTLKNKAINFTFTLGKGTFVYRAREVTKKNPIFYTDEEILEPSNGIPNIGRFNPYGVSILYVSEDPETAKKEIDMKRCQISEIVLNQPLHILDLEKSGGILYRYCNLKRTSKNNNPEEYMLSNFLGQCGCYLKNYCNVELDGFRYESSKNSGHYCYVLFEVHKPVILVNKQCYQMQLLRFLKQ